jgi:major histocompatibility complex class I
MKQSVQNQALSHMIKKLLQLGVVAHAFDPSTWEAEAGGFLSLRPAWSTK